MKKLQKYVELFRISLKHLEFPSPFWPPISNRKLPPIIKYTPKKGKLYQMTTYTNKEGKKILQGTTEKHLGREGQGGRDVDD